MKRREIEDRITKQGLSEMPEINIQKIASTVILPIETKPEIKKVEIRRQFKLAYAVAMILIIIMAGSVTGASVYFTMPQSEVYIDVNPSFKLSVTPANKVKKYVAISDDSKNLFDAAQIEGKSIDDASEYIFETLFEKGYINEKNEIFISATGKNTKNASKAIQKVKEKAEKCLKDKNIVGKVTFDTSITPSNPSSNISPSKIKKINEILALTNDFTQKELEEKSISELNKILKSLSKENK